MRLACGVNSEPLVSGPVDAFIGPLLGLPAWGVKQGHGSFLTFEFGQPKLEVGKPRQSDERGSRRTAYVHGEWHLWIYCCNWRASQDGAELAWSEDATEAIGRAVGRLNGQKLIGVDVAPAEGSSTFKFDLGGVLETWPYGDDPTDEQWIILSATEAFAYRADGFYKRDPSDTPPDQERWLPLA